MSPARYFEAVAINPVSSKGRHAVSGVRCAPQNYATSVKSHPLCNFVESRDVILGVDFFGSRDLSPEQSPRVEGHLNVLSSLPPLASRCRCREPLSTQTARTLHRAKDEAAACHPVDSLYACPTLPFPQIPGSARDRKPSSNLLCLAGTHDFFLPRMAGAATIRNRFHQR